MSNLVQELVQEMGPNNPALMGQPYASTQPMYAGQGNDFSQQMMSQQPQQMMSQQPQQMMQQPMGHGQMMQQPMGQGQMMGSQQQMGQGEMYNDQMMDAQQMQEMMDMGQFGMDSSTRSTSDAVLDQGKELVFLAVAFFILSLPHVDQFLQRSVPQLGGNFYYLLATKGALLAILFFVVRYFELI